MKIDLKGIASALTFLILATPALAAENLLNNPGFEEPLNPEAGPFFDIPGWFDLGPASGNKAILGSPIVGAFEGDNAVEQSSVNGSPITFIFQRLFNNPKLTASPGEEFYASVRVLREVAPVNDELNDALLGLAFFDALGTADGRIDDMAPSSFSKGELGVCPYPGVNDSFNDKDNLNTWQLMQAQGVAAAKEDILIDCVIKAPEDAAEVGFFLFQRNLTGSAAPIWFDDAILVRLDPDDDEDRIENGVDSDPINDSVDFSDGTTSGSIVPPIDPEAKRTLGIDDAADPLDGVRIVSDPGNGSPARVRVCDSSATLSIRPNSDVVVTCGSVILAVAPGSEPVDMIVEFEGEEATFTVPQTVTLTYEPEDQTVAVESSSTEPEPVILTVGETTVPLYPTSVPGFPVAIDVKPGSYPNCFNISSNGVIPVAILGSDLVNVSEVDPNTLVFGGGGVRVRGSGQPSCGSEDANLDGFVDLVCHFEDDPEYWSEGASSAALSGELYDGTVISGSDLICIVP